jgi:hypothetical protein
MVYNSSNLRNLQILLSFICFVLVISLDNVDDEELMMKKTKVLACIAITKSRMAKDLVRS